MPSLPNIAVASNEQNVGLDHINNAIAQMDGVTQQNAALVEQAAAAAESMKEQAAALKQAVSVFKIHERYAAPAAAAKVRPTPYDARHMRPRPQLGNPSRYLPSPSRGHDWETL